MREIRSPLDGILSPFQARAAVDEYAVLGLSPPLVTDFTTEYYRKAGSASTFSDVLDFGGRTSNATMVDSDGLLKWAPHNLWLYSDELESAYNGSPIDSTVSGNTITATTQSGIQSPYARVPFTFPAAGIYTFIIDITNATGQVTNAALLLQSYTASSYDVNIDMSTGAVVYDDSGTATTTAIAGGWRLTFEVDASAWADLDGSFDLGLSERTDTIIRITDPTTADSLTFSRAHLYRSDLGGMVNNPDRGDSYVPTTSSIVYLPRRNHHTWNGSTWVNSGLLLETETRTNKITQSEDFTTWTGTNTATLAVDATGPDGETSAVTLVDDSSTGTGQVYIATAVFSATTAVATTYSVFLKAGQLSWAALLITGWTVPNALVYFDLSSGVVGTESNATGAIEDVGGGWYRCSLTFTTDAVDDNGFVRVHAASGDGSVTVDLDGTSSILIYGAQFEAGATPSSYMPTAGATTTRTGETLTIAAADMPWPTPNVIGTELVDNGDFELGDNGDWTLNGTATISSGTAENLTGGDYIAQGFVTEAGKYYQLTFDALPGSNTGNSLIRIGTSANSFSIQSTSLGSTGTGLIRRFVATGATTWVTFYQANFTAEYDNISVREIDPLSVSLQMQGGMTYADEGAEAQNTFARWYDDANNYITIDLDTDSTDTGEVNFEQKDGTGGTGTTAIDTYSPGILVPYNLAGRNTSTAINGATGGTAGTEDTTPTALPDLSTTDFELGYDYMGCLQLFRAWNVDIADAGIEEASS